MRVGVISDTHGLLRPEALRALAAVDLIVHAGDVGDRAILEGLRAVAPTTAVRGNVDGLPLAVELPESAVVEAGPALLYLRHDLDGLDLDPRAAGFAAVITGHSHRPRAEWRDGVLYFNPGSAGPRRFSLPIALGLLTIDGGTLTPEIVVLDR
ncbi:MAG TPA: metallophosphoesterase family protein [Polyangia bacterium]